ncbi:hypothetical protein SCLCIDRAFT_635321 [Scleroderma citrinum Foug A]|uniref:Uncharacterized protein n=1 Tax=Scleroderma citrinum Foug A TaxID=1036808 RepID=A0A0C3CSE3_9AGAM|nr:hypothetical protein SCLCIDRAFT_635321 [Scleroderma citrinum Foug A]
MDLLYCGTRRGCEKEYWAIGLSATYTPIFFFPLYILFLPSPILQPLHILHAYLKLWLFLRPTFITLRLCGITVFPNLFFV